MSKALILGWSAARNLHGDNTGMSHLIIVANRGGFSVGVPACGSTVRFGQVEPEVPEYAPNPCDRCRKYADREK